MWKLTLRNTDISAVKCEK